MSAKSFVMLGMFVGSAIGGYLPSFFGADIFSMWSIILSAVGGILGIYVAFRLFNS